MLDDFDGEDTSCDAAAGLGFGLGAGALLLRCPAVEGSCLLTVNGFHILSNSDCVTNLCTYWQALPNLQPGAPKCFWCQTQTWSGSLGGF